jgi:hypothetical protein
MPKKKLRTKEEYRRRLIKSSFLSLLLLVFSLLIGLVGYMYFFNLNWIDGLLNASMILTGMGPIDIAKTDAAKIFASFYALYSGVAFLTCVAVIFAPILHRFLHRFHLDLDDED